MRSGFLAALLLCWMLLAPAEQAGAYQGLTVHTPLSQADLTQDILLVLLTDLKARGYDEGKAGDTLLERTGKTIQAWAEDQGLNKTSLASMVEAIYTVKPVETMIRIPAKQRDFIVVDVATKRLTLYVNGQVARVYPVATGTAETPTPIGDWTIVHKAKGWGTGFGTHWLGLNVPWGTYGIHGTNKPWSIGGSQSHGCIRMYNRNVGELYDLVRIGTPVQVINSSLPCPPVYGRVLKLGNSGRDVVQVQRRLQELGFYWEMADGRFGIMTDLAVRYSQFMFGRVPDGVVDAELYDLMGMTTRIRARK